MRLVPVSPQKTNDDCVLQLSFMGGNCSPVNSCVSSWLAFKGTLVSLSKLASEDIRFSSLSPLGSFRAEERLRLSDRNSILMTHNKSGSHGVPKINLSNFTCLLVDFGKVLCSSANELQQNSNASPREDYVPQTLTVLLEILLVCI